jgi:hypothetical protein
MVLYVRQNEETSCLKIVHFHDDKRKGGLPLELEANAKSTLLAFLMGMFRLNPSQYLMKPSRK